MRTCEVPWRSMNVSNLFKRCNHARLRRVSNSMNLQCLTSGLRSVAPCSMVLYSVVVEGAHRPGSSTPSMPITISSGPTSLEGH